MPYIKDMGSAVRPSNRRDKMSNTTELKAQLAAVTAEWNSRRAAVQRMRQVDRVQNEGEEGFSAYEAAIERLAAEYMPQVSELTTAIFASEWTAEVTSARRAAWNSEIAKMGAKIKIEALKALVSRLGYSQNDIARAKALHGIK